MDKLIVGKIVKIHGVKGAVKIVPILDDGIDFVDIGGVYIENDTVFHEFEEVFAVSDALGVKFKDINTVENANSIVGKFLYADREILENLVSNDSFFIEDLKGSKIYLDDKSGEYVGILTEIDNYGSADIFYVKSEKYKNLTMPHIEGLVKLFDEKQKILYLNSDVFREVAVYGD